MSMIDSMAVMSRRFKKLRDVLNEIREFQNQMSQLSPDNARWAIAQCFRLSQSLRDTFEDEIQVVGEENTVVVQQGYVVLCHNPDIDGLVGRLSDLAVFGPFDTYDDAKAASEEAECDYGEVEIREIHTDSTNSPL